MRHLKPIPPAPMPELEDDHVATGCDQPHPPVPGERPTMDLSSAELFVLASLRTWVAPLRAPGGRHPDWHGVMRLGGVATPTTTAFDRVMSTLAAEAKRSLDVRCPTCPSLGADEEAMLALVASLQAGDAVAALRILTEWLPGDAAGAALTHTRAFAAGCAEADIHLPLTPPTRPRGVTLH